MYNTGATETTEYNFLQGGGKLGEIIAKFDWSATSLSSIAHWPQSLKTVVGLILRSAVPMVVLWNEDGMMIYNDAYSVFAGGRHPVLLGSKVREGWPEVADFNDNVMKVVLGGGTTLAYQDQELTLHRNGIPEQVWMNLDYSPVLDENGIPAGVIAIVVETTAKVRAQRWLDGERERLRMMFEQAPGFMAMLSGPEHVFTLANPAYSALVGQRDIIGKSVREVLPEVIGQGFFEILDKVFFSGNAFSGTAMPALLQRKIDGPPEQRYLDLVYQPVRNDSGAVIGIFVQGTDVTDRVLAEESMRTSETQFRVLAQVVPNQVWAASPDGALYWFNSRVYEYSGAKQGELDGQAWAGIISPDDVEGAGQRWAAAINTGESYETEFRIQRADGVYRWHLVRALPIHGDDGEIVRWIGTNTDIEDQKAAARALEHLNATLEQQVADRTAERDRMWRLSTDIMLVSDFQANIMAVNPALTILLNLPESEILGASFMDFIHPDDVEATLVQIRRLSDGAQTSRFENRYRRKDGTYRILSWTAVPDAQFIHAVGRDMTADREAAEAMKRTEQALQRSQRMETIGKLTGGVAHDFNNLLQVISGNLQLLAMDVAGNVTGERRLANALAGVSRGAKLASYLLAFGRRQALEPKVVKVGRFVTGMEDMLRRSLGEEIEIEIMVSGGLWNTLVDTAQVENAVLNLSINARDAMEGVGKLTIEIGNAYLDETYARTNTDVVPGQYVVMAITDTGCGMSPDVLEQAFEPFFSTKPEGKGTGLGLSMVYGFVKQSGGHVSIYSELGHGTTVKLYLPRSHESEDITKTVDLKPAVGGSEIILVAEDDEQVRNTVVEMLSELGYHVLKASDAASALNVIESGIRIDMLFTDVVMPGPLRSPDLARKARERLPHIAVLFTSGYTENAIVHGGRLDAGVDLLGKPYTREALALKIRHVLANQQQRNLALTAVEKPRTPIRNASLTVLELRILLVEDEEQIRTNTAELLRSQGHAVIDVADAESALIALQSAVPDILITDVSLPGISGEELARRTRERYPAIGVIFATGGQDHSLNLPDAVLLRKPYDSIALQAALASMRTPPRASIYF
jgi:PAS domain S-box-containing protein